MTDHNNKKKKEETCWIARICFMYLLRFDSFYVRLVHLKQSTHAIRFECLMRGRRNKINNKSRNHNYSTMRDWDFHLAMASGAFQLPLRVEFNLKNCPFSGFVLKRKIAKKVQLIISIRWRLTISL